MKILTVPVLLTLALCLKQDAASGDANQETCSEFQSLMKNGKLFCSQDKKSPRTPDGVMFLKKCASCKMILEQEVKSQKRSRHLARATENTSPAQLNCADFKKGSQDGELTCHTDSSAVCGTDGRTYRSRCDLCAENANSRSQVGIKNEGECDSPDPEQDVCFAFRSFVKDGRLGCTRESDPVLGPDGKTHGNMCSMCAELFLKEAKEKAKQEEGNRIRRDAEKELCKEFENQVRSGRLFCTRESDPVRGPDGKMHGNKCSLCAEIFMKRFSEEKSKAAQNLRNVEDKVKVKRETEKLCSEYRDRAENGILFCTREHDPILGADGNMHGNLCSMCEAFFKQEKARERAKRATAQEACREFQDQVRDGLLLCTKENDPVIDFDGKMHANKCTMCANVFKLEEEKMKNDREEREKIEAEKVKREAVQELCNEYRPHVRDGQLPCTRENDPIKGLDGKVHGNTCSMCQAFFLQEAKEKEAASKAKMKRETEKDACNEFRSLLQDGKLFCTRENDPVRGPDGKTHGNKCAMCKAVFKEENEARKKKEKENQRITSGQGSSGGNGKDQDPCAEFRGNMINGELSCTRESDPVRGADGKSYNNKCSMCKELLQREAEEKNKNSGSRSNENGSAGGKDVCDEFRSQMKNDKLLCTRESDPVRGPDGKTHGNKCAMCKEKLEKEAAEKRKKDDEGKRNTGGKNNDKEDLCHEFRDMQRNGKLICTRENDPIRGPDGKTHVNKCAMCRIIFEKEANERKKAEEKSRSKPSNDAKDQCRDVQNEAEDAKFRQSGNALASVARISADECREFQKNLRNGDLTCTRQRDLVRGADGKFYRNKCFLCRAILQKEALEMARRQEKLSHTRAAEHEGSLESSSSSLDSEMCKHYRVLPRMGYLCPKDMQPVCGDDGQTYNNPCMLCHENLIRQSNTHIRSKGRCEEKSTPDAAPASLPTSDK